jgi:hypothetical protein
METFHQIIGWLRDNWFGVFGVLLAVLIYRWQKKVKRPRYKARNVLIVENAKQTFPRIQVHFLAHDPERDLDNLSVAVIAIWNGGNETIQGSDITPTVPLVIKAAEGVEILGASIIQNNNKSSNPFCNHDQHHNRVVLTFDYLDGQQGFVVEVLHTGTDKTALIVEGDFKGGGPIEELGKPPRLVAWLNRGESRTPPKRLPRGCYLALLVVVCFILIGGIADFSFTVSKDKPLAVKVIDGEHYMELPRGYTIVTENDKVTAVHDDFPILLVFGLGWAVPVLLSILMLWALSQPEVPRGLEKYRDHLS